MDEITAKSALKSLMVIWAIALSFGVAKFWSESDITYAYEGENKPIEVIVIENVPEPTKEPLPPLVEYIHKKFGDSAERGLKMLRECENSNLNPEAINWNRNGTWDFGIWQINEIHGYTRKELKDPYFNTDVAYEIYKGRGDTFEAWTCAELAGDIPFWK